MLARYLGNKTAILDPLLSTIKDYAEPGAHVVDAFSGSLSVSMALKAQGFRVTANDINLFSAVSADAYLIPTEPPTVDSKALMTHRRWVELREAVLPLARSLTGNPGYTFLTEPEWFERYADYLTLLRHLATMRETDLPKAERRSHIYDTYCEDGASSAFVSSRGTTGRRRFFTGTNAARIDIVLNQLRSWKQQDALGDHAYSLALAGLIRGVEQVANTQGTFHDFIRVGWDSRALSELRLEPPPLDDVVGGVGGHAAGRERDTLEFINDVDDHRVLYLDPPYNFRQYSAYYFLPNVLCRYPEMVDPDGYFSEVAYVRGQNPQDDFSSTFCKASRFVSDLRALIERARCRTVVISYFTGANHWSRFDRGPSDEGRRRIADLLAEDLFEPGSQQVVEVPRRNYASYGGYTAQAVTELLMTATKRHDEPGATGERAAGRLQPVA